MSLDAFFPLCAWASCVLAPLILIHRLHALRRWETSDPATLASILALAGAAVIFATLGSGFGQIEWVTAAGLLVVCAWCIVPVVTAGLGCRQFREPRGARHLGDMATLLVSFPMAGLAIYVLAKSTPLGTCAENLHSIDNHVGNLVTVAGFGAACLYSYLSFYSKLSYGSLQTWIKADVDASLLAAGIDDRWININAWPSPPARPTLSPATIAMLRATRVDRELTSLKFDAIGELCRHWGLNQYAKHVMMNRLDLWISGAALWCMIFVCGHALMLFVLNSSMQNVPAALCKLGTSLPHHAIVVGYGLAFLGILIGVLQLRLILGAEERVKYEITRALSEIDDRKRFDSHKEGDVADRALIAPLEAIPDAAVDGSG